MSIRQFSKGSVALGAAASQLSFAMRYASLYAGTRAAT
jgi:hypothetical protein